MIIPSSYTPSGSDITYHITSLSSTPASLGCFRSCTSLKSVTFEEGNQLTSIHTCAFDNCPSLETIEIPDSVTIIGDLAFYGCTSLTEISIPDSVSTIGGNAFLNCTNLKFVTFGEDSQLTSIGFAAFQGCDSLTSINISNGVTSIERYAFYNCSSLESIIIPNSVTSIGRYAFGGCASLTSIDIPDSITSIGEYAFSGCTSLSSIALNWTADLSPLTSNNWLSDVSSATLYVPFGYGAKYEEVITTSNNIVVNSKPIVNEEYTTSASAFFNETVDGTVSYHFDSGYNIIIDSVNGLDGATSLTLKENLSWNDLELYYTSATTPKLVGIGSSAFVGCDSLESINIPSTVLNIGDSTFDGCSSLTSITLNWTAEQLNGGSLSIASTWLDNHDVTKYTTVYIPEGTTDAYEKAITDEILNFDDLGRRGTESEGGNWDFVDNVEPTPEPSSNSNIGLGVGLGVPAVGGIGFGTYYGVKRKKNKK